MGSQREIWGEINLKGDGIEQLEEFASVADDAVVSLEQVEDGTGKMSDAQGEASTSTDSLTESFANFKALAIVGTITAVAAAITAVGVAGFHAYAELESGRVMLQNIAGEDFPALSDSISGMIAASKGLRAEGDFNPMIAQMVRFGASTKFIKQATGSLQQYADAFGVQGGAITLTKQLAQAISTGSTGALDKNSKIFGAYTDQFKALGPARDAATKLAREQIILNALQANGGLIAEGYARHMKTAGAMMQVVDTQTGNVSENIGSLIVEAMQPLMPHVKALVEWLGNTEEGMALTKTVVYTVAGALAILAAIIVATAAVVGAFIAVFYSFYQALFDGEGFVHDFSNSIVDGISWMVMKVFDAFVWVATSIKGIWDGIFSYISEKISSILTAMAPLINAVVQVASFGLVKNAIGTTATTPPGRAAGGHVSPDNVYRVNERGQEFFSPGSSGSIQPVGNNTGGGISVPLSIQVIVESIDDIKEAVKTAIDDLSINEFANEAGLAV